MLQGFVPCWLCRPLLTLPQLCKVAWDISRGTFAVSTVLPVEFCLPHLRFTYVAQHHDLACASCFSPNGLICGGLQLVASLFWVLSVGEAALCACLAAQSPTVLMAHAARVKSWALDVLLGCVLVMV